MSIAAEFGEEFAHGGDNGAGTANSVVNTPLAFEVMDERVNRSGLKRIATDEQRMKTKDAAQQRIFDVAGCELVDRFVRLQADQIWHHAQHV